jgi:hypothetical protein
MSAFGNKADTAKHYWDVRFVPGFEITNELNVRDASKINKRVMLEDTVSGIAPLAYAGSRKTPCAGMRDEPTYDLRALLDRAKAP